MRFVHQGETMTVNEIVASVSRIFGKRVPVVFGETSETAVQPAMLDFGPRDRLLEGCRTTPFSAAIRRMADASLAS